MGLCFSRGDVDEYGAMDSVGRHTYTAKRLLMALSTEDSVIMSMSIPACCH